HPLTTAQAVKTPLGRNESPVNLIRGASSCIYKTRFNLVANLQLLFFHIKTDDMTDAIFSEAFAKELEAEVTATRKCLERIPDHLFDWKPHEKSMTMGYLALLVAEIPKWITHMIEKPEIDFARFEHF